MGKGEGGADMDGRLTIPITSAAHAAETRGQEGRECMDLLRRLFSCSWGYARTDMLELEGVVHKNPVCG